MSLVKKSIETWYRRYCLWTLNGLLFGGWCRVCARMLTLSAARYNIARSSALPDEARREALETAATGLAFVTEDSRPMLACFICCTKLKQYCRLRSKRLQAEELLTQMMNEDYEPTSLSNQDLLEFCKGVTQSSMELEHMRIVDECSTESDVVKEELAAVCERLNDVESKCIAYMKLLVFLSYFDPKLMKHTNI